MSSGKPPETPEPTAADEPRKTISQCRRQRCGFADPGEDEDQPDEPAVIREPDDD
jgi:hypothetical protein